MLPRGWKKLLLNLQNKEQVLCPNCCSSKVEYIYVGDLKKRVGFQLVWCNSCKQGIRLSRVLIPNDEDMLSFDDEDEFSKRVPEFKVLN
ncbi:hypothetical protein J2Z48_000983 [Croceifilum oryzae]|uniref:Uncharacterized protein n=1 Tax=Croceifilum oryzae TaxID=1553429 RepID=A0AAJ1TIM3_9BACL|nr:hypothetical protein [Croceifilum oryzae]MDQ0416811.1 hypothetical protein [Croceifilum oryzae]